MLIAWIFQAICNFALAADWNAELKAADKIRSSAPEAFSLKLRDLALHKKEMNQTEQDYLEYLEAYELIFKGDFATALVTQERLSKSAVNQEIQFRSLLTLINAYAIQRRWNEGLLALNQALILFPSVESNNLQALAIGIAGVFYNQLGQYALGLEYSTRLKSDFKDPRNQCAAEQLRFEALLHLERPIDELTNSYQSGINLCESADEKVLQAIIVRLYVQYLLENQNQINRAKALLDENVDLISSAKYAPITASFQSLQAKAYWELGEREKAFNTAYALSISPSTLNALEAEIRSQKVLYDYYLSKGDSTKALEAYIKYAEADKANLDEIKTKTLAFQIAEHQSIEQRNKIALLDEQNKLLKVQQQLDQAEAFNNRLLIAVLFCAALGLGSWGWHSWQSQKRLRQLAEYDSLTGLFSRGHFTQVAQAAVSYAQVLGAPVSCILLDVDKFKRINDTLGHATGDWALQTVARVCRETCREHEVIGRIGGEEFCFVLSECSEDNASQLAESLRRALTEVDTSSSGHDFNLSASFGVSSSNSSGYDLAVLMQNADRAMYDAKHGGRNRVCIYQDGEQEEVLQS
ncbi:GGDEF domain-containing protein [Shewanella sedimentimangrovi]|uniref:GGDEF domain-containing protein n=1 Tax=Shewanella sedimentimangrovi TaxID=2814293 RepID=UPI001E3F5F3B|nr:GGDEF domain-containing protein [Shewanella sedimentimangrovi]